MPSLEELRRAAAFARAQREVAASTDDTLLRKAAQVRAYLFAHQLAFLDDPFRFKTVLCPRRAGKTESFAAAMIDKALTQRGAQCVYITITLKVAKRNMWRTLKKFNDLFGLGVTFNNTELSMTFTNGSVVLLGGAETQGDIDKYRGSPFDLIILDESKSFPAELIDELTEEVLTPCLADREGTLVMGGTPGSILAGTFYEATREEAFFIFADEQKVRRAVSRPYSLRDRENWKGVAFKWSHHSWTTRDNVAMPHLWRVQLSDKERNGWTDEHPTWQREYLGRWLPSMDGMVFRFQPTRDHWKRGSGEGFNIHGLPDEHDWRYVLGVDLGYDDDTAFVVFAWAETCPVMYQVYEHSEPYMLPHQMAAKYREIEAMFGELDAAVGDRGGLGKTILAELEHMYGITIEPAEKNEKRDHVELFNADLVCERIKILEESRLSMQMSICQWDETGKKFDKNLPDHCVDAAIYIWRYCYHNFSQSRVKEPERGTALYWMKKMKEEFDVFRAREERRAHMDDSERLEEDLGLDMSDETEWGGLDA